MAGEWQSMPDGKEKYHAYLCSREWSLKRRAVKDRAEGWCERCGVNDVDCVHHLTYSRVYRESLDDLVGLCDQCHRYIHGHSDKCPLEEVREFCDLLDIAE
jgi:hypothetical protein